MKNIVLVGLPYDTNLGDAAIFSTAYAMVNQLTRDEAGESIEIRKMDMTGRRAPEDNPVIERENKRILIKALRLIAKITHWTRLKRCINDRGIRIACTEECKRVIDEKNTAGIVFAGGGIIKYKAQSFYISIDVITGIAEQYGIPVMFNAVGVEGYDENDRYCRLLRNALNRTCVKKITCRDDVELLNNKYLDTPIAVKVADPACTISKIYPAAKRKTDSGHKVIGLGSVRYGLFTDHGIALDKQKMKELWKGIFTELNRRGYVCKIFCNGTRPDYQAGEEIVRELGVDKKTCLVERPKSDKDLTDIINSFDALICGRLHASIISYSYGIPFIGLVWNDKQMMFGESIGEPYRFVSLKEFNAGTIVDRVEQVMQNNGKWMIDREAYFSTTLSEMTDYFRSFVLTN